MVKKIIVRPLRFWERLLDFIFIPVMYSLQFPSTESPQRTHPWNNQKLRSHEALHLDSTKMAKIAGTKKAFKRWWWKLPIFHIPILGGWRSYVVIHPKYLITDKWYAGWIAGDTVGVSRMSLEGSVRLLIGDSDVSFFGIHEDGRQVSVEVIGYGTIGKGGLWKHTPLL